MRISVDVTNPELDAMVDLILCWNLCDRHKKKTLRKTKEAQIWQWTQTCKACIEINKQLRKKTRHLWSKLIDAYLNTKNGK